VIWTGPSRTYGRFYQIPDQRRNGYGLRVATVVIRSNFAETLDNVADFLQTRSRCRLLTRVYRNLPVEP